MKSKTSSYKLTLLRKDIFRFAPLWGIYLIGGLLVMLSTLNTSVINRAPLDLAETMSSFAALNLIYAGLVALTLFGDLYNTRLCYALHAMPMRREKWFFTHVISGFLYSFVPHLVAAVLFMPLLGEFWFVAWAWLLSMTLQYLFFFGLAVLAALLCGNRFAVLAVYALLNFLSLVVLWFAQTMYMPLLEGVLLPEKPFGLLCPVLQMLENQELLNIQGEWTELPGQPSQWTVTYEGFGSGWGYLAICAGAGILLLGVALLLYRRRKLEFAGDFLAFKPLEPVFAVLLALCTGCVFALFGSIFGTGGLVFFGVGLILGWFGGQMLLQRTVKVFKGKAFLKLGALILAMALSLGLTAWDPLGITTFVPDADQIERVEFVQGRVPYAFDRQGALNTTDSQMIQRVCDVHKQILHTPNQEGGSRRFSVRYTLKNGRQVVRSYIVNRNTEAWDQAAGLLSGPNQVLGFADRDSWNGAKIQFVFNGWDLDDLYANYRENLGKDAEKFDPEKMKQSLRDAIWEDCVAGTLVIQELDDSKFYGDRWINVEIDTGKGFRYSNWSISPEMTQCNQWYSDYKDILKYAV